MSPVQNVRNVTGPYPATHRWSLVTYDRRTIPPLLKTWAESGLHHGGVVFVDENGEGPGVRLRKGGAKVASIPIEDLNAENDE